MAKTPQQLVYASIKRANDITVSKVFRDRVCDWELTKLREFAKSKGFTVPTCNVQRELIQADLLAEGKIVDLASLPQ